MAAENMYGLTHRLAALYPLLRDGLSREIFFARLRCDMERSMTAAMALGFFRSDITREEAEARSHWREQLAEIAAQKKKLILYGTRLRGPQIAELLSADGIPFYGFCGRRAAEFPNGLLGKPVAAPEWLFSHAEECYVVIAAFECYEEIRGILREHGFPKGHILTCFDPAYSWSPVRQYFEFRERFPNGTAFVDGGCYDGKTSAEFARWCGGAYSRIFAFEPESDKLADCERTLERAGVRNAELIPAGLSDREGVAQFFANGTGGSHIASEGELRNGVYSPRAGQMLEIRTARLDDVVGDCRVGMIKMDIEGAEYDALHGAAGTIRRDRPLLAVCVYHRPGDLPAIMEYCHELAPEYRFWLRQYDALGWETVLYAAV